MIFILFNFRNHCFIRISNSNTNRMELRHLSCVHLIRPFYFSALVTPIILFQASQCDGAYCVVIRLSMNERKEGLRKHVGQASRQNIKLSIVQRRG
jgi:hypothetical protein